jgi:anti-sigma factor RsiW
MTQDTFTDEELMSYADGQAELPLARRIIHAAAQDPAIAARIEQFRAVRKQTAAAFGPQAGAKVPAALRDAVAAAVAKAQAEQLPAEAWRNAALSAVKTIDQYQHRPAANTGRYALAASVAAFAVGALGFFVGQNVQFEGSPALVAGTVQVASASAMRDIEASLSRDASGSRHTVGGADGTGTLRINSTHTTSDGLVCRDFAVEQGERAVEALACYENQRWNVLVASVGEAGGFAPASDEHAVGSVLRRLGASPALDRKAEVGALEKLGKR